MLNLLLIQMYIQPTADRALSSNRILPHGGLMQNAKSEVEMSDYKGFERRLRNFCEANFLNVSWNYTYRFHNMPTIELSDAGTCRLLFRRKLDHQDRWSYGRKMRNDVCSGLSDSDCADAIEAEMLDEIPEMYRRTPNAQKVTHLIELYTQLSHDEQAAFRALLSASR